MTDSNRSVEFFSTLARVLRWCWLLAFALMLIWLAAILLGSDSIHRLHGDWFGVEKHELQVIFYCSLGFFKLQVLVFFFIPWLAIRLALRGATS